LLSPRRIGINLFSITSYHASCLSARANISPINPTIVAGTAAFIVIDIIPSSLIGGGAAATGTTAGGVISGGFSGGLAGALNRVAPAIPETADDISVITNLIGASIAVMLHGIIAFRADIPTQWHGQSHGDMHKLIGISQQHVIILR